MTTKKSLALVAGVCILGGLGDLLTSSYGLAHGFRETDPFFLPFLTTAFTLLFGFTIIGFLEKIKRTQKIGSEIRVSEGIICAIMVFCCWFAAFHNLMLFGVSLGYFAIIAGLILGVLLILLFPVKERKRSQ